MPGFSAQADPAGRGGGALRLGPLCFFSYGMIMVTGIKVLGFRFQCVFWLGRGRGVKILVTVGCPNN